MQNALQESFRIKQIESITRKLINIVVWVRYCAK